MKLGERGIEFRGIHWVKVELAPLVISVEWLCPLISYWALILFPCKTFYRHSHGD